MEIKINFDNFNRFEDDEPEYSGWRDYLVDPSKEYPDIDFLLTYKGRGLLPRGNLVAFSGRQKSGKSFAVSLLVAGLLKGDLAGQFISKYKGLKVLYCDLEMHVSDVANRYKTTAKVANLDGSKAGVNFYMLSLREVDYNNRLELIIKAIDELKPDCVILDGIADIMLDFNSVEESTKIINRLMRLSSEKDIVLICIIHLNKSSPEMKGHAGSILSQKAAEVFQVEFDKKNLLYTVEQSVSRHAPLENFSFKIEDGIPELVEAEPPGATKSRLQDQDAERAFSNIFASKPEILYSELYREYAEVRGVSNATAKRHIADWHARSILLKSKDGVYTYNCPDFLLDNNKL